MEAIVRIAVIQSPSDLASTAVDVVVLDLDPLGGVVGAFRWLDANPGQPAPIVVAVGENSADMTSLARRIQGVIGAPERRTGSGWRNALLPWWTARQDPGRDDTPEDGELGGVTDEEFAETLFQTALADSDPRKRD
jgi:hypothetical protein